MQAKLIGGIVVLGLIIGAFFFGRMTGIDSVKADRAEAAEETVVQRNEAEKVIVQERVVYRDRIQKIREVVTDCVIPADILRVHHDTGIYRGEVRPSDVQ